MRPAAHGAGLADRDGPQALGVDGDPGPARKHDARENPRRDEVVTVRLAHARGLAPQLGGRHQRSRVDQVVDEA
jgi:hypothetical protein